jgi:FlaA1/EpsC-like NDP-sugar epimerase/lipopolysaccharide/colanic/teichoic acid biosynthesis glycosyltransferase
MIKRTFDLIIAILAIAALSPLIVAVAILVKLDSRGPVFHRQYRVGLHGREFRLYEFRTVISNAHKHGPPITTSRDPRITRMGRLLRRRRIHGLPQLLNVIRGDMSLVGPRPENPTCVTNYTREQNRILDYRPGITSPAAIARWQERDIVDYGGLPSRYLETVLPENLAIDLEYLEQRTFWSDLATLRRTVAGMVSGGSFPLRQIWADVRAPVPWLLIDALTVAVGFYAALSLRFLDNLQQDLPEYACNVTVALAPVVAVYAGVNHVWRLHRRVWRYASAPEVLAVFSASATSTVIIMLADLLIGQAYYRPLPVSVVVLGGCFTFSGMVLARYRWRLIGGLRMHRPNEVRQKTRAIIYGAGQTGQLLARRLLTEPAGANYELIGFIDDDTAKSGLRVHNIPVLGTRNSLEPIVDQKAVDLIILAMSNIEGERLRMIISAAQRTPAQIRIVPNWLESIGLSTPAPLLREVRVDDLLGRQRVRVDMDACSRALKDKIVLVTGGSGSVGSELCRQMIPFAPGRVIILDNNESALHDLEIELRALCPTLEIVSLVGDVTDDHRMDALFSEIRPQVIFHAAAYKHVPLMQRYPEEAVRVNVGGTLVTLEKARSYGAERFVLVSTDKAVNAESVMGATKRLAELLVLDKHHPSENSTGLGRLACTAVRFGNVLGSRGSVVPTFAKQIEVGGPVTVTHPEMTRYFMETSEAAALIIQAAALTEGGEIFMLDMGERIRVDELARKMIRLRGLRPGKDIPIVYVGIRPGEKLHEELTFEEEKQMRTSHPLIYRVTGRSLENPAYIDRAVRLLLRMAGAKRRGELVDHLMALSRPLSGPTPGGANGWQLLGDRDISGAGIRPHATADQATEIAHADVRGS